MHRVHKDTVPPKRMTFFLVRHGESKWNEAQSKINITGMLDRDHGLTELGARQAIDLNKRWKKSQQLNDQQKSVSKKHSKEFKLDKPIEEKTEPSAQTTTETPNYATGGKYSHHIFRLPC
jgi:bisphosphoglycerate-dependent phosphoglycerate mutase